MKAKGDLKELGGRRILIVEDELLLAMDLELLLQQQGCEVLEPVGTVARALAALENERPDAVMLDMNLSGDSSAPVAKVLRTRDIPFVIVTGYTESQYEDPVFDGAPLMKKPYDQAELLRSIANVLA